MNLLPRLFRRKEKTLEGAYRPGPYLLTDGWLSATAGRAWNWWQLGYTPQPYGECSSMVEACISAYAQTVAMCPGDQWRKLADGGRERVSTSALARILRRPNDYESMSDLLLNLTRRLYTKGEAFGLALRNNRAEITELHLMRHGQPLIAEDGSIFYGLAGNEIIDQRIDISGPIPARDVLHVRLHTPRHPLRGESPILATAIDLAMSSAALSQQVAFYVNQSRPSGVLQTDLVLTKDQATELRERWNEQSQGLNAGGVPILAAGLKWASMAGTARDAQLAEILKMSDQNVALAFRIPLQILGIGDTPFASTEALMSSWKASGLGFALNHIEEAFGLLFGLKGVPDEYLEFDTGALLRSAFKDRVEGFARGVQGGIFAPNEARAEFEYGAAKFGDEPRVQQQVVPLSAWAATPPAIPGPSSPPPAPAQPPTRQGVPANVDWAKCILDAAGRYERRDAA